MAGRFVWHPEARLFDLAGQVLPVNPGNAVIADRPAGQALALALACGDGFRIGGEVGPVAAGSGWFEALTGGSLGAPKRVMRRVASWQASFAVNAGLFGIGPGACVAVPGRLCHSLPLYAALEGMHLGAEVHVLDGLRADRAGRALGGMDVVYATPTQMRAMLGADWRGLRQVVLGGERLDASLRAAIGRAAPGARITEFYGAAETSFITMTDAGTPDGSVGRAYPGVEIDVRDGVIWVRSPYLAQGDDWVTVGEMGRLEGGYLFLQGRAGRMVTVAGQNVFLDEIEHWMADLPGVARIAVVAVPDDARGHVLMAAVQGDVAQEAKILAGARAQFGAMLAPRRLRWLRDWPVLPSGKTDLGAVQRGLS
ncbi:MAG: AMP-binding protein [Paracoccaceae bacterium]